VLLRHQSETGCERSARTEHLGIVAGGVSVDVRIEATPSIVCIPIAKRCWQASHAARVNQTRGLSDQDRGADGCGTAAA
jgi:hypothetical protein